VPARVLGTAGFGKALAKWAPKAKEIKEVERSILSSFIVALRRSGVLLSSINVWKSYNDWNWERLYLYVVSTFRLVNATFHLSYT
jgi:hypothetical protein